MWTPAHRSSAAATYTISRQHNLFSIGQEGLATQRPGAANLTNIGWTIMF